MPIAYLILKFFHILLAIAAVGANFTYGAWFARANANPHSLRSRCAALRSSTTGSPILHTC